MTSPYVSLWEAHLVRGAARFRMAGVDEALRPFREAIVRMSASAGQAAEQFSKLARAVERLQP